MNLQYIWSRLESFTALELHRLIQAREAVFIVEQRCPYQETDGLDLQAWHLQVLVDGELAAYCRLVDPGCRYPEPSIGRVLTVAQYRGLKLGRALMTEAIRYAQAQFPGQGIRISAQAHLAGFYGSLGFVPVGAPYDEDGIAHVEMERV